MMTLPLTPGPVNPNPTRYGLRSPKGGCTVSGRFYRGGCFCLPYDSANPHALAVAEPARSDLDLTGFASLATTLEPAPTKLSIHGFTYSARAIPAGECGSVAFELHKLDTNHRYHVLRDDHGLVRCDCPSYVFTHEGTAGLCKHGRRLVELGMIPASKLTASAWRGALTSERVEHPASRRRYEPSPQEMAEASQLFGDLAVDRIAYHHELAAAL